MKKIHIHHNTYIVATAIIVLLVLSTIWPMTTKYVVWLIPIFVIAIVIDAFYLSRLSSKVFTDRRAENMLSLGDNQLVKYEVRNHSQVPLNATIYDELPEQLQLRNSIWSGKLNGESEHFHDYTIRPTSRGEYLFGKLHTLIARTFVPLVSYQIIRDDAELHTKVYPSILQMQNIEFFISSKTAHKSGIKKVRSIGDDDEFDHLRTYVVGNNLKNINWKATSRKGELMVNHYQDTRSQNVYMIIDKGRSMEMPFYGMSLLDYAINTALAFTKIIIKKYDRAGLITYSNVVDNSLAANSNNVQLHLMLEALYAQETLFKESNLQALYTYLRKIVTKRSIIFLFTNFENVYELRRNMSYLRLISRNHLLVVISFINEEVELMANNIGENMSGIYDQTIAESILYDKERIIKEIESEGIMTILTRPQDLTIDVINKYLEIKAKRLK